MTLLDLISKKKVNAVVEETDLVFLGTFPTEPKRISYETKKPGNSGIDKIIIATAIDNAGRIIKTYIPIEDETSIAKGDVINEISRFDTIYREEKTRIYYHRILSIEKQRD